MNVVNKNRSNESSPSSKEKQEKKSKKRNYGEYEDLEAKFTNLVISDVEVTDPVLDLSLLLGIICGYFTICDFYFFFGLFSSHFFLRLFLVLIYLEKQSMSSSRGKARKKAKKFNPTVSEAEFWKKIDDQFDKIEDQYVFLV